MAISNHERIGRALKYLKEGLYPFIEREMKNAYRSDWLTAARAYVDPDPNLKRTLDEILQDDPAAQLKLLDRQWNEVFKKILSKADRSIVNELMATRNNWAHGSSSVSTEDAYRALDSVARLLDSIGATAQSEAISKQLYELMRQRYEEQARRETRKATTAIEGSPQQGLKPWREIVTPHPDIASGRYQQAEFAADLWQVYLDEGSDEYRLPTEFFRRTYITAGLKQLLANALNRLAGNGGDPVIELQTNFGGGKTHAMLALYHLCLGVSTKDLPGIEAVFAEANVSEPPQTVQTVVLVGNKISPGQTHTKKDGTVIHTLWGEIAYQLGGKEGYEMIRQSDETATNPGDTLKLLFNRYAPCVILIDEWVSYARQLHDRTDLPAGSFDTHFTFAQTLSESAKNADRTLLVVSIPSSDIEIGGDYGQEALSRLKNAIGRVESPWRPASAEESFEIVRRRLFQPITDPNLFVARDAVVRTFSEMYRSQAQEFPTECREANYERRITEAYPIHPELFDRLYSDWSTLDKFQRTRGVLRLMAKVIHSLWERSDRSLMILPASVPLDDPLVQSELTRYLEDNWVPVIEKDVDGANSLPAACDRDNPNLGRYSACRRVTRTIYLGSAPTLRAANRGIQDRHIKLGCVQPGESPATFGDALRRLTDSATYIYVDESGRYWISTQPNVTRTASDRATRILSDEPERIHTEIVRRLKSDKNKGEFAGIHIAPESSADIPDDSSMGVRLVVLSPNFPHTNKATNSEAYRQAQEILNKRGGSQRYNKNLLLFVAPDKSKLSPLEQSTAQYLAWKSITNECDILNLDPFQTKQADAKCQQFNESVDIQLKEAYQWALVPAQPDPQQGITWQEVRLQSQESPILKASRKLSHDNYFLTQYAAANMKLEALDPFLWRDVNHLEIKKLWSYLAQYLYLPKLRDEQVLLRAISEGVSSLLWRENFAYADAFDETQQRYVGLRGGEMSLLTNSTGLIVKPEIAQKQFDADEAKRKESATNKQTTDYQYTTSSQGITNIVKDGSSSTAKSNLRSENLPPPQPKRFYGSIKLNPLRCQRDMEQVTKEVLEHLMSLANAEVEITLDIQVRSQESISDTVIRTVTENCRTLKFDSQSFEQD
ncbi:MAG: Swt1 family HEPN domain-containing protein [Pseudanabaena sp.]